MTTAAKAEATKKPHPFTFDGESYTVPNTTNWDLSVIEALEDEKIIAAVRAIVGLEQWAKFKKKTRKVEDLNAFFEKISEAAGIQGNS